MATYLSQAKNFIVNTLENIKEVINEEFPQAHTKHNLDYLNDIAGGRWSKLKHADTVDKNDLKYINWKNYKMAKWDRTPLWNSINAGSWKLRHVETKDTTLPIIERGFKLRSGDQRKTLMNSVRQFNTKRLRFVPWNKFYLDDITGGRWTLKHATTAQRNQMFSMDWQGFKLNRWDRTALWNNIRSVPKLKHVETRLAPLYIEPGYKLRKLGDQRKNLFNDIRSFDMQRLRKPYLEDIANCKWPKLRAVPTTDKTKISTLGWNSFNARRKVLDDVVEFSKNPHFNDSGLSAAPGKAEAMQ